MSTTKTKLGGGKFQSMNLDRPVLKAIYHKGYKVPTPIQKKVIPVILEGRDVVAMARTGSGKTAAFLVPIVQKLKTHSGQIGVRTIILSPTRELALQTYKFTRELTKFTNLKSEVILGGDSMEKQFARIHENPDIIVATPGRLLHLAVEMNLKFSNVQFVVFDEADRLFEMGFKEQLNEIIARLPVGRQTLLFSATLPQVLVDFTKAGLDNPVLIRLDTENKIPDGLKNIFIGCRNDDKLAVLLYLLRHVIAEHETTIVFLPTRHHIEYLKEFFEHFNINATYLYSSLDIEARKLNIAKFKTKASKILLVTDLAARGVDIPLLNNVINYNFPSRPKLFVHRVGRTARAGCSGTAYSLVANDEMPYLFSLNLFLSQPFTVIEDDNNTRKTVEDCGPSAYGLVPQTIIEEQMEAIDKLHQHVSDLDSMKKVCISAYKQYLKTREVCSGEVVKKVKSLLASKIGYHPIFWKKTTTNDKQTADVESERLNMLSAIRGYKPNASIFKVGVSKTKGETELAKGKRQQQLQGDKEGKRNKSIGKINSNGGECFDANIGNYRDGDFYLNYQSSDHHSEQGLKLSNSFNTQINDAVLDLDGDERGHITKSKEQLKWFVYLFSFEFHLF